MSAVGDVEFKIVLLAVGPRKPSHYYNDLLTRSDHFHLTAVQCLKEVTT